MKNLAFVTAAVTAFVTASTAADSATFSYSYVDNGGCVEPGHTYSATYRHEEGERQVGAYVRAAPSGGDCTQEALTYSVDIEQGFALTPRLEGVVKLLVDSRSAAAPYGLAGEDGFVLLRNDGRPLFATSLPAGRAETVAAVIGLSTDVGPAELDFGFNVVPIDWSDGTSGRTLHFGASLGGGPFAASVNADVGEGVFGDAVVSANYGIVRASVRFAFGLDQVDGGEPAVQSALGSTFNLLGSPQATATVFEVGIDIPL